MKCKKHNLSYKYVCPECFQPYLKETAFSSLEEIREYQSLSSKRIKTTNPKSKINLIACLKIKYYNNVAYAGTIFYDIKNQKAKNFEIRKYKQTIPYFPTLLFLRDLEIYLNLAEQIKFNPDCYLLNASGQLHPFLFGVACDFGLKLKEDIPVIGVTKKNLYKSGQLINLKELNEFKIVGDIVFKNHLVGKYLSIKNLEKGIYISVGNNISLNLAIKIISNLLKYRIPEPIRLLNIELNKTIKNENTNSNGV